MTMTKDRGFFGLYYLLVPSMLPNGNLKVRNFHHYRCGRATYLMADGPCRRQSFRIRAIVRKLQCLGRHNAHMQDYLNCCNDQASYSKFDIPSLPDLCVHRHVSIDSLCPCARIRMIDDCLPVDFQEKPLPVPRNHTDTANKYANSELSHDDERLHVQVGEQLGDQIFGQIYQ